MISSSECPHSLTHAGEYHVPLVYITFLVGSSLLAIITSHLSCIEGYFFVAIFSAYQSTRGWDVSRSVSIFPAG